MRIGLWKSLLFILIIWVTIFLLLEGGIRLYNIIQKPRTNNEWNDKQLLMCEPNATRIWQYKADYKQTYRTDEFNINIHTNSWRLRDDEVNVATSPDVKEYRILAIGDSFTFGWGVEESERYTEVLKNLIELAKPGYKVRILNAGYWMYTFDQQYLLLKELVPIWQPDLVIQGLYAPHLLTLQSHQWKYNYKFDLVSVKNDGIRVDDEGSLRFTNEWLNNPPFSSQLISLIYRTWFNWRLSSEAITGDLVLMDPNAQRYDLSWGMSE